MEKKKRLNSKPPPVLTVDKVIQNLREAGNPDSLSGMARFGIDTKTAYGVSIPKLRFLARQIGKNHKLASDLWKSGIHEARILAALVDIPSLVTKYQMEDWVSDFDSWDLCDQCCGVLFDRTEYAYEKAKEWSEREEEFVKRAGFVMMACLAVHDKDEGDEGFVGFLRIIEKSSDERNFVKKAINWALRQIGKRNSRLNKIAIQTAKSLRKREDPKAATRWIASDALRELESESVQRRLKTKAVIKGEP